MKRTVLTATLAALIVTPLVIQSAEARHHRHSRHSQVATDANGSRACQHDTVRVQTAYGISICVDPRFAGKFMSFFSALKARGCEVKEIVCQADGHVNGSNHDGGGACDVDQKRKNVTTASCMYHAGDLIRTAGLYDGCSFGDCGHVEAMRGLGHYGFARTYAARSHRHVRRYASIRQQPVTYARWNSL